MIDDVERYKRVTAMMTYFSDRQRDTFKLFIQLTVAIIGGYVWLKLQPGSEADPIFQAARWIIPFLAIFMSLQIYWDDRHWRGYRKAEQELVPNIPETTQSQKRMEAMALQEASMILAMGIAALFSFFVLG